MRNLFITIELHWLRVRVVALGAVFLLLTALFWGTRSAGRITVATDNSVPVPIIMYHGLTEKNSQRGTYVIATTLFEQDLRYLTEHGYTTIVMADLLRYVRDGKALPPKPIMLTFDDGYYNNYLYAFPLLKKYNARMVLSPIGWCVDRYSEISDKNPDYAHCNWSELKEMADSGLVELQNHSYNMHSLSKGRRGTKKKVSETVVQYQEALSEDAMHVQTAMKEHIGSEPTTFVYPFGAVSRYEEKMIRGMGFSATLECESRVNYITRDPDCLFGLGRYLRTNRSDSASFFAKTQAEKEG